MRNQKGFTLIELIMVTIILGILAAVAIPRYMTTVEKAEAAAEDAVIGSIRSGLETYAVEQLMDNGRRSWPTNPWDALETKPAGYDANDSDDADTDGEWTYNTTTNKTKTATKAIPINQPAPSAINSPHSSSVVILNSFLHFPFCIFFLISTSSSINTPFASLLGSL